MLFYIYNKGLFNFNNKEKRIRDLIGKEISVNKSHLIQAAILIRISGRSEHSEYLVGNSCRRCRKRQTGLRIQKRSKSAVCAYLTTRQIRSLWFSCGFSLSEPRCLLRQATLSLVSGTSEILFLQARRQIHDRNSSLCAASMPSPFVFVNRHRRSPAAFSSPFLSPRSFDFMNFNGALEAFHNSSWNIARQKERGKFFLRI